MIDEYWTFRFFGYTVDSLSRMSHKKVIAVCEECGKYRAIEYKAYYDLCHKCGNNTPEHIEAIGKINRGKRMSKEQKKKISDGTRGEKHPFYGKHLSDETKKKIGDANRGEKSYWYGKHISEERKKKLSNIRKGKKHHYYGKHLPKDVRKKLSDALRGEKNPNWQGGSSSHKYCHLFNEACRESNREKYDRRCFVCGLPEPENITSTGKTRKLSVHHVDLNKQQGCNDVEWTLVPVCMAHHGHSELWTARIVYLLNRVWCD